MPLGTTLLPDFISHAQGGTVAQLTTAQMTAVYGAPNTFTPNTSFGWPYNGVLIHFNKNVTAHVDASLKTLLVSKGLGS